MIEISLRSDVPHFDITVELDSIIYTLEFYWNSREQNYYLTIKDSDDVVIVSSIKVVIYYPLRGRVKDDRLFTGALLAVDSTAGGIDPIWTDGIDKYYADTVQKIPGYGDLGARVKLYYLTGAELAALV